MDQSGTPRLPPDAAIPTLDRTGPRNEAREFPPDDRQPRRLKRRAAVDAAIVLAAAFASATPIANARDSLIVGVGALLVGIIFFLVRRHNDLLGVARQQDPPMPFRGLVLSEWHAGVPLPARNGSDGEEPTAIAPPEISIGEQSKSDSRTRGR